MKYITAIFLILAIGTGCEKESNIPIVREDLIGIWLNQSNEKDYLEFDEWKCLIVRTTDPGEWDSSIIKYTYEIWNDTLDLRISTVTEEKNDLYRCKLQFLDSENQLLKIEGIEDVPPFLEGQNFEKLE
jgi:hypothetical protein